MPQKTQRKILELARTNYDIEITANDVKNEQHKDPYFRPLILYLKDRWLPKKSLAAKRESSFTRSSACSKTTSTTASRLNSRLRSNVEAIRMRRGTSKCKFKSTQLSTRKHCNSSSITITNSTRKRRLSRVTKPPG